MRFKTKALMIQVLPQAACAASVPADICAISQNPFEPCGGVVCGGCTACTDCTNCTGGCTCTCSGGCSGGCSGTCGGCTCSNCTNVTPYGGGGGGGCGASFGGGGGGGGGFGGGGG